MLYSINQQPPNCQIRPQDYITQQNPGQLSSQECLLLQIDAMEREKNLDLTVPRVLVNTYLHDLEMNRLPQIARKSGFTIEQINQGKEFLKHLNARPGSTMAAFPAADSLP